MILTAKGFRSPMDNLPFLSTFPRIVCYGITETIYSFVTLANILSADMFCFLRTYKTMTLSEQVFPYYSTLLFGKFRWILGMIKKQNYPYYVHHIWNSYRDLLNINMTTSFNYLTVPTIILALLATLAGCSSHIGL